MASRADDAGTMAGIRLLVLAATALTLVVTEAELLYAAHTGSNNGQIIAVVLTAIGLATATLHAIRRSTASIVLFRFAMYLFLVFGVDGLLTHYQAAARAALKARPALAGSGLVLAALTERVPALAPGMLIQIGLTGLIYAFRHPLDSRIGERIGSLGLKD
jgi:hypothetical protein